jgi:hypothetical protein
VILEANRETIRCPDAGAPALTVGPIQTMPAGEESVTLPVSPERKRARRWHERRR